MLPQLDLTFFSSQIFWFFICFGLLFLYVNYYFFPRMHKMFEQRHARVNAENKTLERNLEEIKALKQAHEQMISNAKNESNEKVKQAEARTKEFIESKKFEIDKTFNAKFELSKQELLNEINNFKSNIDEEILNSAVKVIEKLENTKINPSDLTNINDKS